MVAASAIIVVGLVAGCGQTDEGSDPPAPVGSEAASRQGGQNAQAVLNEALDSEAKTRELLTRLTENCLRSKGVLSFPRRSSIPDTGTTTAPRTSPTLEQATGEGYGITEETQPQQPAEKPFAFSSPAEEQRYVEALTGSRPGAQPTRTDDKPVFGGCTGQARKAVYGDETAPETPTIKIRETAGAEYASDPALKAQLKIWAVCLEKSNYPRFEDPEDAARYGQYFHYPAGDRPGGVVPSGGPWPKVEARKKEIALAVADARCADQAGLRATQEQAWKRALGAALARYETEIFGYRDAMVDALRRGQQALQG
ncbi:hypothetical protein [Micromonospora zamorensis]|uniref:hypothetical protein n=1 Tax=Micromonospora zamorensis TaxID=709883 RepID=UPI002ED3DECB|nr:hypothetical protein OG886_26325 [Micromonospora zamorensis]